MSQVKQVPTVLVIKDTHRALYYEDGALVEVLAAGRYDLPLRKPRRDGSSWTWFETPQFEYVLVDMRARDLTIKGQEILTSDKVAVRVNLLVQFAVIDPRAAVQAVENYLDRLYSDVQLAARRSLASMTLEEILTNRHRLSEEITRDVTVSSARYGVRIDGADIKDLIFPGNLQEIMNRVLAAERNSQAQLVEARTKAEVQRIEAETKAEIQRLQSAAEAEGQRIHGEVQRAEREAALQASLRELEERSARAELYARHPALLRLEELATLRALAGNASAQLHFTFDARSISGVTPGAEPHSGPAAGTAGPHSAAD